MYDFCLTPIYAVSLRCSFLVVTITAHVGARSACRNGPAPRLLPQALLALGGLIGFLKGSTVSLGQSPAPARAPAERFFFVG